MALALRFKQGDEFFIGMPDGVVSVQVISVEGDNAFTVDVENRKYKITDELSSEILPGVRVSAGFGEGNLVQAVIDAPRSISIDRKWRMAKKKHDLRSA